MRFPTFLTPQPLYIPPLSSPPNLFVFENLLSPMFTAPRHNHTYPVPQDVNLSRVIAQSLHVRQSNHPVNQGIHPALTTSQTYRVPLFATTPDPRMSPNSPSRTSTSLESTHIDHSSDDNRNDDNYPTTNAESTNDQDSGSEYDDIPPPPLRRRKRRYPRRTQPEGKLMHALLLNELEKAKQI